MPQPWKMTRGRELWLPCVSEECLRSLLSSRKRIHPQAAALPLRQTHLAG